MRSSSAPAVRSLSSQSLLELGRQAALRRVLLMAAIVVSIAFVVDIALAGLGDPEIWLGAVLVLTCWATVVLVDKGQGKPVLMLTVLMCFGVAALSSILYGSTRTGSNYLYVCAVVVAGVFLSRKALLWTLGACVLAIAVLSWAEMAGLFIAQPTFEPTLRIWKTQMTVIIGVAGVLYFNNQITQAAAENYIADTERRLLLEDERDRGLERFMHIFRTAPSPLLVQSARTGSILDANPAFEKALGYRRIEVLGARDDFLWADADVRRRYVVDIWANSRVENRPVRVRKANGSTVDVLMTSEISNDADDHLIITSLALPDSEPAPDV